MVSREYARASVAWNKTVFAGLVHAFFSIPSCSRRFFPFAPHKQTNKNKELAALLVHAMHGGQQRKPRVCSCIFIPIKEECFFLSTHLGEQGTDSAEEGGSGGCVVLVQQRSSEQDAAAKATTNDVMIRLWPIAPVRFFVEGGMGRRCSTLRTRTTRKRLRMQKSKGVPRETRVAGKGADAREESRFCWICCRWCQGC